jgi:hypothetical protein
VPSTHDHVPPLAVGKAFYDRSGRARRERITLRELRDM